MKKILVLAAMAFIAACNSSTPAPAENAKSADSSSTKVKDIQSPYAIMYSSKFTIDDPKNAESLLALWKSFDNGDLSSAKDLFADTVEMNFADGMRMRGSRDSIISMGQAYRNTMTAVSDEVHAIMAVKSTDKDGHWALIWGTEKNTHKNGKVDSVDLQETWKFNKDGKAELMYQFKADYMAPKAAKGKK